MKNSQKNIRFLTAVGKDTKKSILTIIATHYGISTEEAYDEVAHEEAEHLLDYVTGSKRNIIHLMMQQEGCL